MFFYADAFLDIVNDEANCTSNFSRSIQINLLLLLPFVLYFIYQSKIVYRRIVAEYVDTQLSIHTKKCEIVFACFGTVFLLNKKGTTVLFYISF